MLSIPHKIPCLFILSFGKAKLNKLRGFKNIQNVKSFLNLSAPVGSFNTASSSGNRKFLPVLNLNFLPLSDLHIWKKYMPYLWGNQIVWSLLVGKWFCHCSTSLEISSVWRVRVGGGDLELHLENNRAVWTIVWLARLALHLGLNFYGLRLDRLLWILTRGLPPSADSLWI